VAADDEDGVFVAADGLGDDVLTMGLLVWMSPWSKTNQVRLTW